MASPERHQLLELAEDRHRRRRVEDARRRPGAAAVLVVHEELVRRGQPGLEVPGVEDQAHARAGGLERLGVGDHLGQRRRRVGRVEPGLREGGLVVVQDGRRDGEGERPLHAVDLPVGQGAGQVVARRVLGRVHARLDREERAGVDGRLGALVLELHGGGELAVGEAGQVLLPGVVVTRLGHQGHVHLGLRGVEGAGDRLQRRQVGFRGRLPEVDVDHALVVGQRLEVARGQASSPPRRRVRRRAGGDRGRGGGGGREGEECRRGETGEVCGPHAHCLAPDAAAGPAAAPT